MNHPSRLGEVSLVYHNMKLCFSALDPLSEAVKILSLCLEAVFWWKVTDCSRILAKTKCLWVLESSGSGRVLSLGLNGVAIIGTTLVHILGHFLDSYLLKEEIASCLAVVPDPRSADPDHVCLCLRHLLLALLQWAVCWTYLKNIQKLQLVQNVSTLFWAHQSSPI